MKRNINIPSMFYKEKRNGDKIFSFSDLPIIKTLAQVPKNYKITDLYLMASNCKFNYIFGDDIKNNQSVSNLVIFFSTHTEYSIDDMNAVLHNNIKISVHDDNEITFSFPKEYRYNKFITDFLKSFSYNPVNVISTLIKNKDKYLLIAKPDKLVKAYSNFEEFCNDNE